MRNSFSIAVMGDIMIDIDLRIPSLESLINTRGSDFPTEIQVTPGGSAANTASWLSLCGDHVVLFGAVGEDFAGSSAEGAIKAIGVVPLLKHDPHFATGMCLVMTEGDGSRTMIPSAGANAYLGITDLELLWPPDGMHHFHLSAYSLFHQEASATALKALQKAYELGATISLDPASHTLIPHHLNVILQALRLTNVLLANQEEAEALFRSVTNQGSKMSPPVEEMLPTLIGLLNTESTMGSAAVVTLGEAGSASLSGTGEYAIAQGSSIHQIESSSGAGDAFNAGFLHTWLTDNTNLQSALQGGNHIAAQALTRVGASPASRNS